MIILPLSFQGSPQNMQSHYQDAMAIVMAKGKPDLFLTFTCNPNWPEIRNNLAYGEKANFRPDLVSRVFHGYLMELLDDIKKKHIFGKTAAVIYTIEFQKRGLPHCHMLITLKEEYKLREIEQIDQVVTAELPDPNLEPDLYARVTRN